MSLQSGSDDHFGRLVLHLLMLGWCTFVPLVGMLLVDWVWPVRQLVSEPGGCEDRPRRSTNKRHALGVLLKGIGDLFVNSGSGHELHFGFFFHCGRWRRLILRQRWSAAATDAGCSCSGFICNFSIFQEYPVQGAGCKVYVLMESNPFSQKKNQETNTASMHVQLDRDFSFYFLLCTCSHQGIMILSW